MRVWCPPICPINDTRPSRPGGRGLSFTGCKQRETFLLCPSSFIFFFLYPSSIQFWAPKIAPLHHLLSLRLVVVVNGCGRSRELGVFSLFFGLHRRGRDLKMCVWSVGVFLLFFLTGLETVDELANAVFFNSVHGRKFFPQKTKTKQIALKVNDISSSIVIRGSKWIFFFFP